jgi:hypothetical protein
MRVRNQKKNHKKNTGKVRFNMPRKTKTPAETLRGAAIRFTKGQYAGQKGWVNSAKTETSCSMHVIINQGQPAKEDYLWLACVRKTSVAFAVEPESVEHYVLLEDPKVVYHLAKLTQALAECGISATPTLMGLLKQQIDLACAVQLEKGKHAKYSETALRMSGIREKLEQNLMNDYAMADAQASAEKKK